MKKFGIVVIIMLLAVLAISLTACNTPTSSEGNNYDGITDDGLTYFVNMDGETCTITGIIGTCINAEISIPTEIDGYMVTAISNRAFSGCSGLRSIIIPDTVTTIGYCAFINCSNLTSITLPFVGETKDGSVNSHFGYIFGAESNLYNGVLVPDRLREVVITGGTIDAYAFKDCFGLTSVTIGKDVTYIGEWAFDNCYELTKVIFKDKNGWYLIDSYDLNEEKISVDLRFSKKNATYLVYTYGRYYWLH